MTDYQHCDSYIVWRRNDGYVSATCGSRLPRGWKYRDKDTGELVEVTFEELLVTDDWPAAHARIRAERVADEMLASW
jgi:hypothetical protein